jgi:hypothetical protein
LETVGDSLYNECGDLVLKTKTIISAAGMYNEWISVYIDDVLVGVYEFDVDAYEYDEKKALYNYRFKSIQKIFFENAETLVLAYSSTSSQYNYGLNGTAAKVSYLHILLDGFNYYQPEDQYAFCLGDMLANLAGKHNSLGYLIDTVTQPAKKIAALVYDLPVLWRGLGVPDTVDSEGEAINLTFYRMPQYIFTIRNFRFTVSGITIEPGLGAIYENNGSEFAIISTSLTAGAGYLYAARISGTNNPNGYNVLTKVSGTGDDEIIYSGWNFHAAMITEAEDYSTLYQKFAVGRVFQVINIDGDEITMRRISGTGDPDAVGYLHKNSGDGDSYLSYSAYEIIYENYNTNWFDILKFVAIIYNSFIYAVPKIVSSVLKIDIKIIPRIVVTPGGQITVAIWVDRFLEKNKYIIDGVVVNALNYEFLYGSAAGNIFQKSIDLADPGRSNSDNEINLYFGITSESSGTYDYEDPRNAFYKYGGGPFIQDYYEDLIGAGDGYSGTMLPAYNDGIAKILKVLDQILFNTTITIELTSINISKNFLAKIEGIKL